MVKKSSQALTLALAALLPLSINAYHKTLDRADHKRTSAFDDRNRSWLRGTSLEGGALYGLIDEGRFTNLSYATTESATLPPASGSNSVLQQLDNNPSWYWYLKGSKWLTKGNDRDASLRYRNLGNNISDRTQSPIIKDTLGQVFSTSAFPDAVDGAAGAQSVLNPFFTNGAVASMSTSLNYQDIDLKSRNFSSMDPILLKGLGNIRVFNSYGVKWVNIRKSLLARYSGLQSIDQGGGAPVPIISGNAVDTVQFGTNANAGGVRIGMGGLWQFNHSLSLDGEFGVGILAGDMKFDYNETYTNTNPTIGNASYNEASNDVLWTAGLLDLEVKLNMAWEFKNNKTATFSVGYEGEKLGFGTGSTRITRPGSTNSFAVAEVFSQQNLLLSVKLSA